MAQERKRSFAQAVGTAGRFVLLLGLIKASEIAFEISFSQFGIRPRETAGLPGILVSPLLHGNVAHLAANTLPLFVLLTLLFWDRHYRPVATLASIWMASGVGTWLIGRGGSVHIGASSLIYGLIAFLITSGLKFHSFRSVVVAVGVLLAYGGAVYGILPQDGPISWEGHLCGAVAGILAAQADRRS